MFRLLFALLFACNPQKTVEPQTPEPPAITYPWDECSNELQHHACNFEAITTDGLEELYQYYQRPIVLDLSTMWCGYCQVAGREAQLIQDQYSDKGLVYITVLIENFEGMPPTVEDLEGWKLNMGVDDAPVWGASRDLINLTDPSLGWDVTGWPTFYFIDEDMVVQGLLRGYSHQRILEGIEFITKEDTGSNP